MPSPSSSPAVQPNGRRKRATVPEEQRKRVRVACYRCRANKLKCDGSSPCHRCSAANLSCTFVKLDSSKQHNDRDYLDGFSESPSRPQPEGNENSRRGDQGSRLVVHHAWTQRTYVQDQDRTHFDGPSSAWAFFDNVRETIDGGNLAPSPTGTATAFRHSINSPLDSSIVDLRADLTAALPPRNILDFLCSTFFKYCQSNYLFVHPAVFNRKLDAFFLGKHEFAPHGDSACAHRAIEFTGLLYMMLAMGSQYADLEQEENRSLALPISEFLTHPPSTDFSDITPAHPCLNPGWQFYQVSKRLLSDILSSSSMTSIEVCVLQGSFLVTTGAHDVAYNLYGLALRMAVNMGLHRAISLDDSDHLHPYVRELRNRLWWSVYTLERFFTFHMGRPLMIDEDEIDTPLPADLPDLQVNPQAPASHQIALVRLCKVMGRIVKALYSSNRLLGNRQVIDIDQYVELKAALEQWEDDLPPGLHISPTTSRSTFHLHLTQKQGMLLLSRIMLRHAIAPKDPNMPTDHQERVTKFLHDAARDCVSAALATIGILTIVRDRGLLCRFSYQDPLYCSAALHVLLLGAKLEPPSDEKKRVIIAGILILRELADGSENAASSLPILIQGFEPFFEKKHRQATASSGPENLDPGALGYRAWRAWMKGSSSPMTGQKYTSRGMELIKASFDSANPLESPNLQQPDQPDTGESISLEYLEQLEPLIWGREDQAVEALNGGAIDQPFWLPGLDETFSALGDEVIPAAVTSELNLWDIT